MISCLAVHVCFLQYLDLTLLAANSATAISSAVITSAWCLGEPFIPKYDAVALLFITAGCMTIVLNANYTETTYTAEQVIEFLKAPKTLCFFGFCCFWILVSICVLSLVLRRVRMFEKDVERHDETVQESERVLNLEQGPTEPDQPEEHKEGI